MNAEVLEYRTLIYSLRRTAREIDIVLNQISRYESLILSGFVVNDSVSFNKELSGLKETLLYKKTKLNNVIIPGLKVEMENLMAAE